MPPWPLSIRQSFIALAPHAPVAGPLCRAAANGDFSGVTRLRDICAAAGIAEARSRSVEKALEAGAVHCVFVHCGGANWRPGTTPFGELAVALEAVALYQANVHVDDDVVNVVLTPPGKPSRLGDALRARGWIESDLEHTDAILRHLATQTRNRFAVLSPFIDEVGMDNLITLFKATKDDVKRVLVARCPNGVVPPPLQAGSPVLTALGVTIYNYWLPHAGGYETFHAKVLLADDQTAYIGSANMTHASLFRSMELGTFLQGNSVKILARVLDAILAIAPRLQ